MTSIAPPNGRWWCADYEDGSVWPCEVLAYVPIFGGVQIRPLCPAPDEGVERWVVREAVYDNRFKHPRYTTTREDQ